VQVGVTQGELKEIVYLMTVTSGFGFPRAIDRAQTMREVFAERPAAR
jgi:4-carboxymuconolactone decarboxylase